MPGRRMSCSWRRDWGPWPAGVYAITVRWRDGTGTHTGTWHVELRPGLD